MESSFSEARSRTFLRIGALLAFLDVAFGAFGAHALRERLTPDLLAVFETGVRYQMYHALAILIVAVMLGRSANARAVWAGWCFVAGIILFSGSLYILALTGVGILGAITPIGGLFFLAGWLCLLLAGFGGQPPN